jgi:YVTN family beta-propeller protein
VSVISARTNTVTATIPVGQFPLGVAADPRTKTIYVANFLSDTVSVISARTNTVVATIRLGRAGRCTCTFDLPFWVAVNPRTNTVYVTNEGSGHLSVSVINARTNKAVARIRLPFSPEGIAVNPRTNTAYVVTDHNLLSVINGKTNKVVTTITAGSNAPGDNAFGVAADPRTGLIYVTNPDSNTVTVINGETRKKVATVRVGRSPFIGIAVDPRTGLVYVANLFSNTVSVLASCRKKEAASRSAVHCRRS